MSATSIIHWFANNEKELVNYLASVGVDEIKLNRLTGPTLWGPADCKEMHETLRQIIFGPLRLAQFDDIEVPYQYVGKMIAEFVHPFNWMSACQLFKRTYDRAELQAADENFVSEMTPIRPTRLFAFVDEWAACSDSTKLSEVIETRLRCAPKVKVVK